MDSEAPTTRNQRRKQREKEARKRARAAFDALWQAGFFSRSRCYEMMFEMLGVPEITFVKLGAQKCGTVEQWAKQIFRQCQLDRGIIGQDR